MSVADLTDVGLDLWGGYCPAIPPSQLPAGASPNCQDVIFPMGTVRSRPRLFSFFPSLGGNPTVNGLKTYSGNAGNILLVLDSLGNLYQEATPGSLTLIQGGGVPGAFLSSISLFGREYMALGLNGAGIDMPRQFDGTNYDRVSQAGPGASPTAADSATVGNITAGKRQVSVAFITRQGFITCPGIPTTWTAAGGKQVTLTNIPIGPPNVVARLILFTQAITAPAVTGPFFSLPTGTPQLATPTVMQISDNTTTTVTLDFLDAILAAGFSAQYLFAQVELGECAAVGSYNSRTVWIGERNKLKADGGGGGFNNIGFDGGFGTGAPIQANVGPNYAGAAADGANGNAVWANPNNATGAPDGIGATSTVGGVSVISNNLNLSGYGFAIPSNATILGIKVAVTVKGNPAGALSDFSVSLSKGAARSNGNLLGGPFAVQSYGGSNDLWGASWSPADINAAGFGVSYSITEQTGGGTASVDAVGITVYYTTPSGAGLPPLGWTQGASFAGGDTALNKALPAYWGDAFAITGDGATAVRGQITQTAFQDYLGNPIISTNTGYGVRARIRLANGLAQGTLHINLQSTLGGFTTGGLAVQANQLTGAYKEFIATLTTPLSMIPSDLLLQLYADGTPTNGGTFLIDCIEVFPIKAPVNTTFARLSHANNPESFDGLLDVVQIADLSTPAAGIQQLRASWKIRSNLYLAKDHYLCYVTDDGQNEPSSWQINEVSNTIGCSGANAWDGTEEWVIHAERSGAYITTGSDPVKVSQEIQEDVSGSGKPAWNAINWNAGTNIWVRIDKLAKRALMGVPINGAATPNLILQMDYKFSPNGTIITEAMAPTYSAFTGRILVHGSARKWAPWNVTANCASFSERPDGTSQLFLGNGVGNGKVYEAVDASIQGSDDGVPVNDFYLTYGNPSKTEEEMLQLRAHMKFCGYLTGRVTGSGLLSIQAISPYRTTQVRAVTLSLNPAGDFERKVSINGERIAWQVGTNAVGNWFQLERLIPCLKAHPTIPVRGLSA